MPEPKGRGGKKPKYQIADIGGTDLTSEDISTERVLNFLIRGEIGSIGDGGQAEVESAPSSHSTARPEPALLPENSVYSDPSEPLVKKSLSHLFERAGGSSGPARDSINPSSEVEPSPVPSSGDPLPAQLVVPETLTDFEPGDTSRSPDVNSAKGPNASSTPSIVPSTRDNTPETTPPAVSIPAPADLVAQVERWKSLYRLNSGEIAALRILCLLASDDESSACYIKMRKLAEMSSLDYRYCQKVVRSLERLGWVTKLQEYDASTQMGVLYRVHSRPVHLT